MRIALPVQPVLGLDREAIALDPRAGVIGGAQLDHLGPEQHRARVVVTAAVLDHDTHSRIFTRRRSGSRWAAVAWVGSSGPPGFTDCFVEVERAWYVAAMANIAERFRMTADEYLAWEREQPIRHEFYDGDVFAMAGGSPRHSALSGSVIEALRVQLRGRCTVFTSDQRVVGLQRGRYVYPDVSVVCGSLVMEPGTDDVIANPTIIVEVLSSSTEKNDRGLKWVGYQRLESLTDYVLVSQTEPLIEHYRRDQARGWSYRSAVAGGRIVLSNEAVVDVDMIFAGILELPGDRPSEIPATE